MARFMRERWIAGSLRSGGDLMPWNFQKCRPESTCLGANRCQGSNTGTLCEQCQPGFTNQRSIVFGAGRGVLALMTAWLLCVFSPVLNRLKSIQIIVTHMHLGRPLPGVPFHGSERVIGRPAHFRVCGLHSSRLQSHDLLSSFCSAPSIDYLEDCDQLPCVRPSSFAAK